MREAANAGQVAPSERVLVIDGLRGFAILLVLFFHIYLKTHFAFGFDLFGLHLDAHSFIAPGFLGVEVFFFVSGFCLMLPYAAWKAGRRGKQSLREYVSRRFWKIVPSYYLALAFVVLFYPFDAHAGISRATDVLLHLSFLHGFSAVSFDSLNAAFWSLAVEVEFYLIFPLIVWGFLRAPVVTTTVVTLGGLGYSWYIAAYNLDGTFLWPNQLLSFLPLFAIGAFCAWIYERHLRGVAIADDIRRGCAVGAVASVAVLAYVFEWVDRTTGGPAAWGWENAHRLEIALVLAVFTLCGVCATPIVQRWLGNPFLAFFSDISYNVYLWNGILMAYLGTHMQLVVPFGPYGFVLLSFFGSTILGYMLTRWFERPLMRFRFGTPLALWRSLTMRRPASTSSAP